jgi:hypothetical protein
MSTSPSRRPRLGPRDNDIFEHVLRYRLTTRDVLHRLYFADAEPNAVTKVTSRLCKHALLSAHRFETFPSRSYYALGPEGARLLGVSSKRAKPLGVQALPIEFATLMYCAADSGRERLTRRELEEHHPHYLVPGVDAGRYYLDREGETTRLAYIRVDCGGAVDHVVRKCRGDLEERQGHASFASLIERGQFLIAVVTGREEKATAIREAIRRHQWPIRFRVEVVPELLQLMPRVDGGGGV